MRTTGTQITIREPRSAEEFELYYSLRWRILREPLNQPRGSEQDEHERDAVHLMAWANEKLAGVGRLHFNSPEEAQIRFMAIEEEYRGRGVGAQILHALESRALDSGARRVVLNARNRAVHFYEQHGYDIVEKSTSLYGAVDHWKMSKQL